MMYNIQLECYVPTVFAYVLNLKRRDKVMTKIDIFSGFLGAGKTTLIKKLLRKPFPAKRLS